MKDNWTVAVNQCRCHPETCACDDWAVYDPEGEKVGTFFDSQDAEIYALELSNNALMKRIIQLQDELG